MQLANVRDRSFTVVVVVSGLRDSRLWRSTATAEVDRTPAVFAFGSAICLQAWSVRQERGRFRRFSRVSIGVRSHSQPTNLGARRQAVRPSTEMAHVVCGGGAPGVACLGSMHARPSRCSRGGNSVGGVLSVLAFTARAPGASGFNAHSPSTFMTRSRWRAWIAAYGERKWASVPAPHKALGPARSDSSSHTISFISTFRRCGVLLVTRRRLLAAIALVFPGWRWRSN